MTEKLFNDFQPATKQEWTETAIKDLKGEDFTKRLITKSIEGFSLLPFYTQDDIASLKWLRAYENIVNKPAELPGFSPRWWHNAVSIDTSDVKTAVEEIKLVLENGADAIILEVEDKIDFHQLLKDVLPQYIQIWIKPAGLDILSDFLEWFEHKGLRHSDLSGGLILDLYAKAFSVKIEKEELTAEVMKLHHMTKNYSEFKGICIDAAVYNHAGGHAVQEIGYSLALAVEILDEMTESGIGALEFFDNFYVKVAVGSNYFMEMAKIKTFRIAFHQLSILYGIDLKPAQICLFAETSQWTKSYLDPYNNIIRNTSEAMASILGGCNTLYVHPHDEAFTQPDNFSKRMARNISNILKEESYFDKVIDPAAGSYYLDTLVNNIYHEALKLLKDTESLGGWWLAYQKHILQEGIRLVRKEKHDSLSTRKATQVGVNQYVNSAAITHLPEVGIEEHEFQLMKWTLDHPFVELKCRIESFFKKHPHHKDVLILPLSLQAKPRIEFARNFFQTAGFTVNESMVIESMNQLILAGKSSKERLVVLCGTDDDYNEKAVNIAEQLKTEKKLLVLAGYPQDLVTALIDAGLKHFVHLKTNLLESVDQITEELRTL